MTGPIDAFLFDLDGTLVDSLQDLADAANETLAARGLPTHPVEAYRRFVGDGVVKLVERILPAGAPDPVDEVVRDYRARYGAGLARATRPFEGVPALLARLQARAVPFGVLSNKPHDATVALVEALFPATRFGVVFGERPGVPRKPDPAGALEAAQALGVDPARVAFVGDTSTDMDTAVAAGMRPIGVRWGFRDEDELRAHGAERVVETPAALEALLEPR